MRCKKCNSKKIIKYGLSNGKQRYKCKEEGCQSTFFDESDKNIYTKSEKRFLSMLINFLELDTNKKLDLKEMLSKSKEYSPGVGKIKLKQEYTSSFKKNLFIKCYNPRLIICEDSEAITLIKLPVTELSDNCSSSKNTKQEIKILNSTLFKNARIVSE